MYIYSIVPIIHDLFFFCSMVTQTDCCVGCKWETASFCWIWKRTSECAITDMQHMRAMHYYVCLMFHYVYLSAFLSPQSLSFTAFCRDLLPKPPNVFYYLPNGTGVSMEESQVVCSFFMNALMCTFIIVLYIVQCNMF